MWTMIIRRNIFTLEFHISKIKILRPKTVFRKYGFQLIIYGVQCYWEMSFQYVSQHQVCTYVLSHIEIERDIVDKVMNHTKFL